MQNFSELPLSESQISNLSSLGFIQMRPVQARSLPHILEGSDVRTLAKTGSGKTLAFGLGIIQKINPSFFACQGLVLTPTHELADQVAQEIRKLARALPNIKVLTLCGGVALRPQIESLKHGAHIIVGTPGRILDLIQRGDLDLSKVKVFVLDECDRMLDMGFFDDIGEISKATPLRKQTLLFSATFPEHIKKISEGFQRNPVHIELIEEEKVPTNLDHIFFKTSDSERFAHSVQILKHYQPISTLAFCNTRTQCEKLSSFLNEQNISSKFLHGEMEKREREDVLLQFSNKSLSVLVATDVAARGLDIEGLDAVLNIELSPNVPTHIHRIGRTGRHSDRGLVFNLVTPEEMYRFDRIDAQIPLESKWEKIPSNTRKRNLVAPMRTISIKGGKKDKLRKVDLIGAMTKHLQIPFEDIGIIHVADFVSFIAVKHENAEDILNRMQEIPIKNRSWMMRLMD